MQLRDCNYVTATLNHLASLVKWLSVRLWTKWFWIRVQLQSLKTSDFAPVLSKEFLDIQAAIELGFTLKWIRDMTRTYREMHRTDDYSEYSSIISPVWPNAWVFVYKLSGSGFESSCSHLNLRFRACFKQGVPWHSDNYRVWIHSETRTWHDKNIQSFNFKLRSFKFKTGLIFYSQSRIISVDRFFVNRMMINIIALIY